ncbi:type VII secretion-associated serine protease mycosin [Planosporangium thailandense]|uniref:Type VII secretion-associated serine protease mycosin n=1 Tax=Planosporangium thailandense TaxID=765197 RepID=A0ABX0XZH7_9ACTN|nr:type VII secretion-associated serine protease mycosin [Planosporangium thailandense]NJC70598.1 type VII secretion-associated serine protease mycosin [Planosporangium thailandense]
MIRRLRRWWAVLPCTLAAVLAAAPPAAADQIRDDEWHLDFLHVAQAHRISQGDGVTVAVIDTGVNADHPDLAGNVLPGVDLTGADTKGQQDVAKHGTAMAGLIAAHGHGPGGADGVQGIAPHAKILPIRVNQTEFAGKGSLPDAIETAITDGAKVISISLASGIDGALEHAVQDALDADVVIVAAAGNRPVDGSVIYPARLPGVVAVGAIGRDGALAPISMTGPEVVLAAPGVDVLSTCEHNAYCDGNGTSDATAIVSGAAALIRSKYPNLPAKEVVHRLTATATDKGAPGRDPEYGYGVLNLVAALTANVPPESPAPATSGPSSPGAAVSQPAAEPSIDVSGAAPLKFSPLLFVCLGVVAVLFLGGVGVAVWLVVRARNKPPGPVTTRNPPT